MVNDIDRASSLEFCKAGYEFMSESSVVICGIARDCSSQLSKLIPRLEELASLFRLYKIIVVENDSQDSTGEVIKWWASQNQNVLPVLFSENKAVTKQQDASPENPGDFNHSRISRIAFARNLYLHELKTIQQTDYVIVVDLDIMDFSIPGIVNSFEQRNKWDCVTSAGLRYTLRSPFRSTVYWDTYAYEPLGGFPDGAQHLADIRANQNYLRERLKNNLLIPASSAFGGLAIYRYQILLGRQYAAFENNDSEVPVLCEHVHLHRTISEASDGFRLAINPLQTLKYEPLGTILRRNFQKIFAN